LCDHRDYLPWPLYRFLALLGQDAEVADSLVRLELPSEVFFSTGAFSR